MKHDQEVQQALGARLAAARRASGLSLQGVADKLAAAGMGVSRATVGAWEDGRNVPDALVVGQLARIYAVTADALAGNVRASAANGFPEDVVDRVSMLSVDNLRGLTSIVTSFLDAVGGSVTDSARNAEPAAVLNLPATGHKGQRRITGPYVAPKLNKKGNT